MDIWQSGVPDRDESTGWLGRWLDTTGRDPLRALSLGPTLPKLLSGAKVAGASIPLGALTLPGGDRITGPFRDLDMVSGGESPLAARIAQSGTDLLTVVRTVGDVLATQPDTNISFNLEGPGTTTPSTLPGAKAAPPARAAGALAAQLDLVARMIKGGVATRVYSVSLGGFDTHINEKDAHARLMAELDTGIAGFLRALTGNARAAGVVVMAYSEFGRRVAQNASGGTDHGTAAPVLIAGPGVKGGFYGDQPSFANLDSGDLKFNTDFRAVYATLSGHVLGVDPKMVLDGKSFTPLSIF